MAGGSDARTNGNRDGENEERKFLGESVTNGCVLHQPKNRSQEISENSKDKFRIIRIRITQILTRDVVFFFFSFFSNALHLSFSLSFILLVSLPRISSKK